VQRFNRLDPAPATAAASVRQESRALIDQHRAGAALPAIAAGLGAGEPDNLAQVVEQQRLSLTPSARGRPFSVSSKRRAMGYSHSNNRPSIQFGQPQTLVNLRGNARSPRPDGLATDAAFGVAAGPDRVSRPSTASSPASVMRWVTSKLERRNSPISEATSTKSPNLTGTPEARLRIDQRHADDVVGANRSCRGTPSTLSNISQVTSRIFEEAAVEDDAGGIAMAPFDA